MKEKGNRKITNLLKNGGLFLFLLILTFYLICRDSSPKEMAAAVARANISCILLAVCAMCLFLFCEGLNIARALRLFGYEAGQKKGVKYALVGFFFSAVTPSASGGQPMQLYYMSRDNIEVSHGTLALLFELLSFQTVTIGLGIAGYLYQSRLIGEAMGNLRLLLLLGISANAAVMGLLICALFSKKMMAKIVQLVVKLIRVFSREKAVLAEQKLSGQLEEYRESAVCLKQNKAIFFKTVATTMVQLLAMYSVPFLIYKSFGLSGYTAAQAIALQAVLYVSVSALPLPGALGVSESAFMMLFRTLFPQSLLSGAMVLSRGVSFYLFVLVSGLCASAFILIKKKEVNHGIHHSHCGRRQGYCSAAEAVSGKQRI